MNELQLSLIAAGAVVVLLIFVYNKWQEWRHRRVAEQVFAQEHPDVLLGGQEASPLPPDVVEERVPEHTGRREPVLGVPEETAERLEPMLGNVVPADISPVDVPFPEPVAAVLAEEVAPWDDAPETLAIPVPATAPVWTEEPAPAAVIVDAVDHPVPVSLLNPECDGAIRLELVSPLRASELLPLGVDAFNRTGMPVYWLGLSEEGEWTALAADMPGVFRHLRLVMQLATRKGPVGESAINLFVQTAEDIAVQLNAVVDVSDMASAAQRSRKIDQFCVDVDLQIGLNLVGVSPFLGTKIRALAEAAGMALNWQGGFEMRDDHGLPLFVLNNQEVTPFAADTLKTLRTHGLTFVLDVPRVPDGGHVFDHMLRLARQFSEALQAHLVDDNRQPLTPAQLSSIRQQFVVQAQADMAARGITAGSPLALRLFS